MVWWYGIVVWYGTVVWYGGMVWCGGMVRWYGMVVRNEDGDMGYTCPYVGVPYLMMASREPSCPRDFS